MPTERKLWHGQRPPSVFLDVCSERLYEQAFGRVHSTPSLGAVHRAIALLRYYLLSQFSRSIVRDTRIVSFPEL
jgi:hypothetical protein